MSQMQGMDVDGVRRLAHLFTRSATQLEHARRELTVLLHVTPWSGPDAHGVREEWHARHQGTLDHASRALREACQRLLEQADEQERASGIAGPSLRAAIGDWFRRRAEDVGSVVAAGAGWVNDRIEDGMAWLSDGVDWVTDRVGEGVGWLGDRAAEGMAWLGDRAQDVIDFVAPRVQAAIPALATLGRALGVAGSQVTRIFSEGRIPQVSELLASGVLVAGAVTGLALNVATGRDHGLFAPGEPWAGMPVPNAQADKTTGMTSLAANTMSAYGDTQESGKLRVEAVTGADGVTRYIVSIPGTQANLTGIDGWSHNDNARNWPSNLWGMAQGSDSTASRAVMMAIRNSVPPGAEILLTGHSQGGLIAANVASDPAFGRDYRVAGVVGFGAPMDCADIPRFGPGAVPVLSVQHGGWSTQPGPGGLPVPRFEVGDIVPKLDLGGSFFGPRVGPIPTLVPDVHPNITNVVLPQVGPDPNLDANHRQSGYVSDMGSLSPENARLVADFELRTHLSRFYATGTAEPRVSTVEFGG